MSDETPAWPKEGSSVSVTRRSRSGVVHNRHEAGVIRRTPKRVIVAHGRVFRWRWGRWELTPPYLDYVTNIDPPEADE